MHLHRHSRSNWDRVRHLASSEWVTVFIEGPTSPQYREMMITVDRERGQFTARQERERECGNLPCVLIALQQI